MIWRVADHNSFHIKCTKLPKLADLRNRKLAPLSSKPQVLPLASKPSKHHTYNDFTPKQV